MAIALAACGSDPAPTLPFVLNPAPTETSVPGGETSTPIGPQDTPSPRPTTVDSSAAGEGQTPPPPTEELATPVSATPLNADDLDYLPDDPTELMFATFDHSLAVVGRKMAYSHNPAFIPVLLEFMRFQPDDESRLSLAAFMVRIRDEIPADDFSIVPFEQDNWGWWVEVVGREPGRFAAARL